MNRAKMMHHFTAEVGRDLRKPSHRINRTFGNRYKSSQINSQIGYEQAYKYVYTNPLRADMGGDATSYKHSTLSRKLGFCHLDIRVSDDNILFKQDPSTICSWLNDLPNKSTWDRMRYALSEPSAGPCH